MVDVTKIVDAVEAAAAAYQAALRIAAELASVVSPADQAELKARLARVRTENDAGHERLQSKLDAIIAGAKPG